jgi:hypothetical protein
MKQDMENDIAQARALIEKLPQRKAIKDGDIDLWIQGICDIEPERLVWHARRLGSFGGSDIGCLVADFYNRERFESIFTHQKPRDIIAAKLLKVVPSTPKEDAPWLFRGNYFEDNILNLYVDQLREQGNDVEIDSEFHSLFDKQPIPSLPWLQGNIDLSLIINGKRQLTDIKAPSEASLQQSLNYGYPFDYFVQLNTYNLYAKEKMKLRDVDYPVDSMALALMNFAEMKVHTLPVEISPDLTNDIITIGNNYWNNFVMKGKLPESSFDMETLKEPSHLPVNIVKISQDLSAVKLLSTRVTNRKDELTKQFNALISSENLPKEGFEVPTGIGSIKGKEEMTVIDEAKLWSILKVYGIEQSSLMKNGKPDIKSAIKSLQILHKDNSTIPIEMALEKSMKFEVSVTRKKSGVQFEQKDAATNIFEQAISLIERKTSSKQDLLLPDVVKELNSKKDSSKAIKKAIKKKKEKDEDNNIKNLSSMNMI